MKTKKEVESTTAKVTSYDVIYHDGSIEEKLSVDEVRPIIDRAAFLAHKVCSCGTSGTVFIISLRSTRNVGIMFLPGCT